MKIEVKGSETQLQETMLPHSLEVYLPDRYVSEDSGDVVQFSSSMWCSLKSDVVNVLLSVEGCSGLSFREESGVYRHSDSTVYGMRNTVVRMFSAEIINRELLISIVRHVKSNFRQKSVLIIQDGVAYLY